MNTIKKNKEWNIINRHHRIYKKNSLNNEVNNVKKMIETKDIKIQL